MKDIESVDDLAMLEKAVQYCVKLLDDLVEVAKADKDVFFALNKIVYDSKEAEPYMKTAILLIPAAFRIRKDKIKSREPQFVEVVEQGINNFANFWPMIMSKTRTLALNKLYNEGLIDFNKFNNDNYVEDLLLKNIDSLHNKLKFIGVMDLVPDFVEIAELAYRKDKKCVALVLFAIAMEHSINQLYRDLLKLNDLNDDQITEAIRTLNITKKISWFLKITAKKELPKDLYRDITNIFNLRNSLVHYKAPEIDFDDKNSSWENLKNGLEKYDIAYYKRILSSLRAFIDEIYAELFPNAQKIHINAEEHERHWRNVFNLLSEK